MGRETGREEGERWKARDRQTESDRQRSRETDRDRQREQEPVTNRQTYRAGRSEFVEGIKERHSCLSFEYRGVGGWLLNVPATC